MASKNIVTIKFYSITITLAKAEVHSVFVPAAMHLDELELLSEQRLKRVRDGEAIGRFACVTSSW